ncbi:hypothetical protein CDAR_463811 [Caerostris darwini]|uniref:Uncharacterized protein n=1 Tax=Caerostris darwini TaxID=1538125 RepID=A0AAV4RW17_9ARAC|nr:hypothetical protein CDAR_463811 [Caerostris darwini]
MGVSQTIHRSLKSNLYDTIISLQVTYRHRLREVEICTNSTKPKTVRPFQCFTTFMRNHQFHPYRRPAMTGQFAWESSKGRSHLGLRALDHTSPFLHPHRRVEWATFSCCMLFILFLNPFLRSSVFSKPDIWSVDF